MRLSQQDKVSKASRLLVQSTTQNHPQLAHEHAIEAKIIIDDIIAHHGGVTMSEKNLKLPKGRLENLRTQIYQQYGKIAELHPELDPMSITGSGTTAFEEEDGGGTKSKHRASSGKRHHKHR